MQVFWTRTKGLGIRVFEEVQKRGFVLEIVDEIVTNVEMLLQTFELQAKGVNLSKHTLSLNAHCHGEAIVDDDNALCIDGSGFSNIGRFLNHRYEHIFLSWFFFHC